MRIRLAVLIALVPLVIPIVAAAQLVDRRQGLNWTDKPLDPATQRRKVTYCVDPPPAGAPAGTAGAVNDAANGWNATKSFPGGIEFVPVAACDSADIHVSWGQNRRSWGTTNERDGADSKGQQSIEVETRNGAGGWLTNQQVENILRHELGHAAGLNDNAGSGGVMKPQAAKADLAGGDLPIGAVDVGANRMLNFDFYDVVKPPINASFANAVPVPGGYNYTYALRLAASASRPVGLFNVTGVSALSVISLPPGWNAHYLEPIVGMGGSGEHFALGTMACVAIPGFEVPPGGQATFTLFSTGAPEDGWVWAQDLGGEVAEIGEVPSMVTAGGPPVPASSAPMVWVLGVLLLGLGAHGAALRWRAARA